MQSHAFQPIVFRGLQAIFASWGDFAPEVLARDPAPPPPDTTRWCTPRCSLRPVRSGPLPSPRRHHSVLQGVAARRGHASDPGRKRCSWPGVFAQTQRGQKGTKCASIPHPAHNSAQCYARLLTLRTPSSIMPLDVRLVKHYVCGHGKGRSDGRVGFGPLRPAVVNILEDRPGVEGTP